MASAFGRAALGATLSKLTIPKRRRAALLLFLATASHGLLDAMTPGGLGTAFFSPWDLKRYFFNLRPIRVSPIDIKAFFGGRGLQVLASEARWVGLPCVAALWWQRLAGRRAPARSTN